MAAVTKNRKLLNLPFSPERLGEVSWNFVWSISRTLMLIDIKMKKVCSGTRSQWTFENSHQHWQNLRQPWHLSPFKWLILWNHCTHESQISHSAWQGCRASENKIQAARESNLAAFAKNSWTTKINLSSWTTWYIWLKFLYRALVAPWFFRIIKMRKKSTAELDYNL